MDVIISNDDIKKACYLDSTFDEVSVKDIERGKLWPKNVKTDITKRP